MQPRAVGTRGNADIGMAAAPHAPAAGIHRPYDLESLLAVVVDVFNARGYDATRMEDLSRALGITKGAIYHHVQSKEELLRLALDRALDGMDQITREAAALDKPAVEQLEHVVRGSVRVLQQQHSYMALLLRLRNTTPASQEALSSRRAIDSFVTDLVREAQQFGDIRSDIDAWLGARLLMGMVNSLAEWYQPSVDAAVDAAIADTIVLIAFQGLRTYR